MTVSTSTARQSSANHSLGQEPLEKPNVYLSAGAGHRPTSSVPNTQQSSWALKVRGATASRNEQTPRSLDFLRLLVICLRWKKRAVVEQGWKEGLRGPTGTRARQRPPLLWGNPDTSTPTASWRLSRARLSNLTVSLVGVFPYACWATCVSSS